MANNRIFRVFVSSTFEDFQLERESLRNKVWPELENFCKLRSAAFEAIDLRWGIPANSAEDLDIVTICLEEVERCQKLTPRPNFIAMIGDRYGWRPLPVTIPIGLFAALPATTKELIEKHYSLDKNAVPAVYLLNRNKDRPLTPEQENELLTKIRHSLDKNKRTPELEDHFFKSATHLEITEGILKQKNENAREHFFSCFRDIKELSGEMNADKISGFARKFIDVNVNPDGKFQHDADAKNWLENLKKSISAKLKNNPHQIVKYQTTLEELSGNHKPAYINTLCQDIEKWLKKVITEELAILDQRNPLEIEKLGHQKFKDQRSETFGGRSNLRSDIKKYFNNPSGPHVICIQGESGSGKTALMSKMIDDAQPLAGQNIIYRFIGATPNSVDLNYLLKGIVEEVNTRCNLPQEYAINTREEHVNGFAKCLTSASDKRLFIFIDALDQLNNLENAHSLYWLPQKISTHVTLVLSVLNGPVREAVQRIYPAATFIDISPQCRPLDPGEAAAMLKALLQKKPARALQTDQENYVLENFNKNPLLLYLKLVVENARHWHSFDSIEVINKKNIGIKATVDEQIKLLFNRWSQNDNYGPVFVKHALSLIASSREGISEKEITGVLWRDNAYRHEFEARKQANQPNVDSLPPVIWSRFFFEIEPFIMERITGDAIVFDFFHRQFKEVVKKDVSSGLAIMIHNHLADYFSDIKLHPLRFISQDGAVVYNTRKLIELPYHQVHAGLIANAYAALTDFVFIESKVKIGRAYELIEDFELAIKYDTKNEFPLLRLIAKALRIDINFIVQHPDCLFQSLYNNCWWYNHQESKDYYRNSTEPTHLPPGKNRDKLSALTESWKNTRGALTPGFRWLRALQPPAVPLDGPQQSILKGLSSPVICVKYSPGDDKIYAICNIGEFITWDASSQNIVQFIPLTRESSIMFKPNSQFAFNDNTEIKSADGGVIADHPGFEYWAWPGIVSQNGEFVLGGSFDGAITLWKISGGKNEKIILKLSVENSSEKPHRSPARGLAFSADNKFAVTGHGDGSLHIWDLLTNQSTASFKHKEGWVNGAAISADGSTVVTGGGDSLLYVWKRDKNTTDKYHLMTLPGHSERIWCVAISDDGRYAASGSDDKSVRLWDLDHHKELKCLHGHSRWVQVVVFNRTNTILASCGGDGKIVLWDVKGDNHEPVNQLVGHDDSVLALDFSHDGKKLLSGSRDQSVRVWDIGSQYPNVQLEGHTDRINCACFSSDGMILVTGGDDNTVRLWHADSGKPVKTPFKIGTSAASLRISPDNNSIWVGCDDGSIEIWDLLTHKFVKKIKSCSSRIYALDISRDSKLVASGSQDGKLNLWLLRTFENVLDFSIEGESILSLALSSDSSKLAAGMRSGIVILWEITTNNNGIFKLEEICQRKLFDAWVEALTFSKDGKEIEARGGSWRNRKILVFDGNNLSVKPGDEKIQDGAAGSFGQYRLSFTSTGLAVKNSNNHEEIAWYPKMLEFAVIHPQNRQWAGVQRYNLHHFRLEGGV